jgi:hypothetical protein
VFGGHRKTGFPGAMVSDNKARAKKSSSVYVINNGQCRFRKEQSSNFRPVLDIEMVNPHALPGSCSSLGGGSRVRAPLRVPLALPATVTMLTSRNRRSGRYGRHH